MFCPLHRVSEMQQGKDMKHTLIVGSIVGLEYPPVDLRKDKIKPNILFAKVKCQAIKLNPTSLAENAGNPEVYKTKLKACENLLELSGYMTVAVSAIRLEGDKQGMLGLRTFQGTLTRERGTLASFRLARWSKNGDAWNVDACITEPVSATSEFYASLSQEERKCVVMSIVDSFPIDDSLRKIPKIGRETYLPCGFDTKAVEQFNRDDILAEVAQLMTKKEDALFEHHAEDMDLNGTPSDVTVIDSSQAQKAGTLIRPAAYKPSLGVAFQGVAAEIDLDRAKSSAQAEKNSAQIAAAIGAGLFKAGKREEVRKELKKYSDKIKYVVGHMPDDNREEYGKSLMTSNHIDDDGMDIKSLVDAAIKYSADSIKENWRKKPTANVGATGRKLFEDAISRLVSDGAISMSAKKLDIQFEEYGVELVDAWRRGISSGMSDFEDESEKTLIDLISSGTVREVLLYEIYAVAMRIRGDMYQMHVACMSRGKNALVELRNNPYALYFLGVDLSCRDLDRFMFFMLGVDTISRAVIDSRSVIFLDEMLTEGNGDEVDGSTAFPRGLLQTKIDIAYKLSPLEFAAYKATKLLSDEGTILNVGTYAIDGCTRQRLMFSHGRIGSSRASNLVYDLRVNRNKVLDAYIESSCGVQYKEAGVDLVASRTIFEKELFVYNKIYSIAEENVFLAKSDSVTDDALNKCIAEFEKRKSEELGIPSFKLEERQAEAVRLIKYPVMAVSGPAGSGKTTTAEAIVYAIEKLYGVDKDLIAYAAPTGKAANRLKECVRRKTRTIHGLFRLGVKSQKVENLDSINQREEVTDSKEQKFKVLILDECAMVDLNLMYNVMMRVDTKTMLIFLGDIEQLTAIGYGKPFANLLQFLPCVYLNVSKRASESSYITKNSLEIISKALPSEMEDLLDADDFRIVEIYEQADTLAYVESICDYHLGRRPLDDRGCIAGTSITPVKNIGVCDSEDIQVVTPIKKAERAWGSAQLNKIMQNQFCPRDKSQFALHIRYGNQPDVVEFRVGDRVIHTTKNISKRTQFSGTLDKLVKRTEEGIMNGDVGHVLGFIKANDVVVYATETRRDEKATADYRNRPSGDYVMAVEFGGVDDNGDSYKFIILYDISRISWEGRKDMVTSKTECEWLELAYALTVHKMQGSQAKITIVPIFYMGDFISRNMLYTAVSRAKEAVYLLGSVYGVNSAVTKARCIEKSSQRMSVLDTFLNQ